MTIGEKLKKLRTLRGMTQGELAGEFTSRNMICQIERGSGNPSLATLQYLAEALAVDAGYFLSEDDDLQKYLIYAAMPKIRTALYEKRYRDCIRLCEPFCEDPDDEIKHVLTICYLNCGKENFEVGYLESAKSDLLLAKQYAEHSLYSQDERMQIEYYLNSIENPRSISEYHKSRFPEQMRQVHESLLYRQIIDLISGGSIENAAIIYDSLSIETIHYRRHINARLSMARYNYERAKTLLQEIIRDREKSEISVPFLMQIFKDLEHCCKSTGDYESAYRCAKQLMAFSESSHR
ncbi:MAG: helix-turn-helix transcriptional regulator [Ruminococcaceae bacterium]|nr:helix-turn-helix transcriptional regulator [Oscillospiraceae bacterium]